MSDIQELSFIGGGNMASAIIDSLILSKTVLPENISVYDTSQDRCDYLKSKGVHIAKTSVELAQKKGVLFLAVKPQVIDDVLHNIRGKIQSTCVVSIAAGISVSHIKNIIGDNIPVVRALPNTPMLVLEGMTVVAEAPSVSADIFDFILSVFKASGEIMVLPEERINEVIPLSSSSPAFFFRMLKAMAESGARSGISFDEAFTLSAVAMCGSAGYALKSGKSVDELIRQVSSPGGTTIAALSAFDDFEFEKCIEEAFKRCVSRAYELGTN